MMKRKGFTLIEMIIVIAIIGVLGAMLLPSIGGYIDLAKKKATVENGRTIYLSAIETLTTDEDAWESFYAQQGTWVAYEATPDGCIIGDSKTYKGVTSNFSKRVKIDDPLAAEGNYRFTVVARVDGKPHKTGSDTSDPSHITRYFSTWGYSDRIYEKFVKKLCAELDMKLGQTKAGEVQVKMPYNKREDGGSLPLVRWLIVYRLDDPTQVEIWAGDGYKCENGPAYRVYPNPAPIYS